MMSKRKAIGKKVRFEVLKRDKFTCQWCGRSPVTDDVVLQIDHIVPVKEGGDNNVLNLVTSCFDCNIGKGATKLDDNRVVAQQKKQLDLQQDKKEQLDLLVKWHKELQGMGTEETKVVIEYINDTMVTRSLNAKGESGIARLTKKFKIEDILKAVDLSAEKYFRFDGNGEITEESAGEFVNKIGGVLYVMNQPVMKQRISYIKGICRNRFQYFDMKVGSIILNKYGVTHSLITEVCNIV